MSLRIKLTILLTVLALLLTGSVALASDITNALYFGDISATNNGTATGIDVALPFDLDTQALIDDAMLNSTATDAAIRSAAGVDMPFMPGANSTLPWVFLASSFSDYENASYYLFTGNVTGGLYRYFNGLSGMTVIDTPSMEPGANFTFNLSAWIDTTASANGTLINKDNACSLFVSPTVSENVTAEITATANVTLRPNAAGSYCNIEGENGAVCPNHYQNVDEVTADGHTTKVLTNEAAQEKDAYHIEDFSFPNGTAINSITIFGNWATDSGTTYYQPGLRLGSNEQMGTEISTTGSYHDTSEEISRPGGGTWTTADINDLQVIVGLKLSGGDWANFTQTFIIVNYTYPAASVTATGISSGEYTVSVTADTANLSISIDGILQDSVALSGASVPDTSDNWTFGGEATLYINTANITINGVLQGSWAWEYNADNFTDQSGQGHAAYPSFRTSSSSSNVTAELISFTPYTLNQGGGTANLTQGFELITKVPAAPTGLYEELNMTFFGAGVIQDFAEDSGIPLVICVFTYAFFISIGAGLLIFAITHSAKAGRRGSLLSQAITTGLLLLYFSVAGGGVIPAWIIIPFVLEALACILWRESYNPWG